MSKRAKEIPGPVKTTRFRITCEGEHLGWIHRRTLKEAMEVAQSIFRCPVELEETD